MGTECVVGRELLSNMACQTAIQTPIYVDGGEFLEFALGIITKFFRFQCEIGCLCVDLRLDRNVLACSH